MATSDADPKYLVMSDDELLLTIGNYLAADTLGSKPLSDLDKRQLASRWFNGQLPKFKKDLCGHLKEQTGPRNQARNDLFKLLCDLLSSAKLGVPVGSIAAKILNYGITTLCSDE